MKEKETDWKHIEEIMKRSKAGDIAPPKRGFLGLIHRCPKCNHKVKKRYFEKVWRNIIWQFIQFFQCPACDWQYVKE